MVDAISIALLILILRTIDVSIGTLKTIFIIENRNLLAPGLGFAEATVYVIAASLVFTDLGNPFKIVGFGSGFALGTATGMFLAQRLGLGSITVRMVSSADLEPLVAALRASDIRLTTMGGVGRNGPVSMIVMTLRKRKVPGALAVARPWLDQCYVTVGDEPLTAPTASAVMEVIRRASQLPLAIFGQPKAHP